MSVFKNATLQNLTKNFNQTLSLRPCSELQRVIAAKLTTLCSRTELEQSPYYHHRSCAQQKHKPRTEEYDYDEVIPYWSHGVVRLGGLATYVRRMDASGGYTPSALLVVGSLLQQ